MSDVSKELHTMDEVSAVAASSTVPTSIFVGDDGTRCVRFGDTSGMQICSGEFSFSLNASSMVKLGGTTIYQTYQHDKMKFPKLFSSSPTVYAEVSERCRQGTDDNIEFLNPYWFGNATASLAAIQNLDVYSNKKLSSSQTIHGRYIAIGSFDSDTDRAETIMDNAFQYLNQGTISGKTAQVYYINQYNDLPGTKDQGEGSGWCSEFASVACASHYSPNATVKAFVRYLSKNSGLYLATNNNKSFDLATMDDTYNSSSDYAFGKVTASGVDLRFSCTLVTGDSAVSTQPQVGDLIFFPTDYVCHTGLVVNVNNSYIFTVEGNEENQYGTNSVVHKRRKLTGSNRDSIIGIGRIAWS